MIKLSQNNGKEFPVTRSGQSLHHTLLIVNSPTQHQLLQHAMISGTTHTNFMGPILARLHEHELCSAVSNS